VLIVAGVVLFILSGVFKDSHGFAGVLGGIGWFGFRDGSIRHRGNQLPDGLRRQSGALYDLRTRPGPKELFAGQIFVAGEIETGAGRQA
jgi:hypothetical protein